MELCSREQIRTIADYQNDLKEHQTVSQSLAVLKKQLRNLQEEIHNSIPRDEFELALRRNEFLEQELQVVLSLE